MNAVGMVVTALPVTVNRSPVVFYWLYMIHIKGIFVTVLSLKPIPSVIVYQEGFPALTVTPCRDFLGYPVWPA